MTGKEDLFDELEDVLRECSEHFPKCDYQIYEVNSAFNQLKKELTKYKRAFEIFKKYNTFTMVGRNKDDEDYVISTMRNLMFLDKEEYELLEELMKGERTSMER